jgi:catechol 2,3-dioxygenase-like lactoylglutathione lyase family enzyme
MIRVDHIGVPARIRLDAARFLASLFDLDREIPDDGRFAKVRLSPEFTIVFFDSEHIEPMHVAFLVDDDAFDAILRRLQSQRVAYGSQPNDPTNGRIDHPLSERGLFFQTPDGHLFELRASSSDRT